MKISKSYIKQVIREELEELSQDQLVENQLLEEGFKEFGAAVIASLALATGAQAKPVTVTSETNGVQKTYVVDAPDDVSSQEIQMYLQKKANAKEAAKLADQRSAPIFFVDVHDSTPGEVAKLPAFKKSEEGGVKVVNPSAAKKVSGAQATEVSSKGNTTVYKVTGAKDTSDATQAAMNAKMGGKGGSTASFNGNAKPVPDGAGGYTVTLTGNLKESQNTNILTKNRLKQIVAEELSRMSEGYGEADIKVPFGGKVLTVTYGTAEWSEDGSPYAIKITTPKGTALDRFKDAEKITKIFKMTPDQFEEKVLKPALIKKDAAEADAWAAHEYEQSNDNY